MIEENHFEVRIEVGDMYDVIGFNSKLMLADQGLEKSMLNE